LRIIELSISTKMTAEVEKILKLWGKIVKDLRVDLANVWGDRELLEELEEDIDKMESEVLDLLDQISKFDRRALEKEHQYHKLKKRLVHLLHHIKPSRQWQREITHDLILLLRKSEKTEAEFKELERKKAAKEEELSWVDPICNEVNNEVQNIENEIKTFQVRLENIQDGEKIIAAFEINNILKVIRNPYFTDNYIEQIKNHKHPPISFLMFIFANGFGHWVLRILALIDAYFDPRNENFFDLYLKIHQFYITLNKIPSCQIIVPKLLEPPQIPNLQIENVADENLRKIPLVINKVLGKLKETEKLTDINEFLIDIKAVIILVKSKVFYPGKVVTVSPIQWGY